MRADNDQSEATNADRSRNGISEPMVNPYQNKYDHQQ